MFHFIGRRIISILLVAILIVFFAYLGMGMVRNSQVAQPDYDLVQHGLRAWGETRSFIAGRTPLPEAGALWQAYSNSMGLLLTALAGAALIGLTLGAISALVRQNRLVLGLLLLTIVGISIPSFFAGLLLQVGELRYLAIFGRRLVSMAGFGWDLEHMLMPVIVLAARPVAYLTRAAFLALTRIMQEDYIRTAFSKGLSLRQAVSGHAVRNIAVPVLTALGVSVRFSLSTLPVVELFFQWPGMGIGLLDAINARQTTMVVALATAIGLTFLLTNLLLEIAFRIIDPRMRES